MRARSALLEWDALVWNGPRYLWTCISQQTENRTQLGLKTPGQNGAKQQALMSLRLGRRKAQAVLSLNGSAVHPGKWSRGIISNPENLLGLLH